MENKEGQLVVDGITLTPVSSIAQFKTAVRQIVQEENAKLKKELLSVLKPTVKANEAFAASITKK